MAIFHQQLKQSVLWRGLYFVSLFLLNIFLSRFLKADGIGIIYYLANLFSLFILIGSFNMDGSFTYFSASKKIHHNQLALVAIIWTIIIGVLSIILLPTYFNHFDNKMLAVNVNASKIGFYYLVGILLINYFTALFYSLGNFFLTNIILAISNLLFISLICFGWQTNAAASAIINDYFLLTFLQGLALAVAFFFKNQSFQKFSSLNRNQLNQLFKYSAIGLTGNFIFFFVYRIDYWFVKEWCHQTGDLGNYIQASKLSQMLLILPQILASTIFPQMAGGEQKELVISSIGRLFRLFLIFYLMLFIAVFLLGNWAFPIVFGNSFTTMYDPVLILLPGIFCLSFSALLSAYFSGRKQNKYNIYAAIFALIVMIFLSLLLKEKYNIKIAALISTIAYCCEACYCFIIFSRQEKINLKYFFAFSMDDFKWIKKIFTTNK
jgi:O-antigen/teichoic acid export membrane protein